MLLPSEPRLLLLITDRFLCELHCLERKYCGVQVEDEHMPVVLDFMKDFECLWNTNTEHYGNKNVLEIAAHEIVRLNFTELTTEGV